MRSPVYTDNNNDEWPAWLNKLIEEKYEIMTEFFNEWMPTGIITKK
jgi:hypothetical protein